MRLLPRLGLLALALGAPAALAQGAPAPDANGPGLRFNGLGRSYIQQSELGGTLAEADTATAGRLSDGEFVLDLAVNAQPNRVTEVQGVIRLRNEFGGFFGAGATVEIRELWARGVVADRVRYRLGDMDLALTPYTLFLPEEDGVVNEPELFVPQREVIDYEEFYTGENTRRLQGGTVDFGLAFDDGLEALDTRVFIARLRATDFQTVPTRLIGGGQLGLTSTPVGPYGSQARLGATLSHVWDDLESGNATRGIRNSVYSLDLDATLVRRAGAALRLTGELGRSFVDLRDRQESLPETDTTQAVVTTESLVSEDDTFFEIGLAGDLDGLALGVSARFVNVGPDFYSAAAQSKRVDYTRTLESYNRVGNDRAERDIALFDLTRDPGIYTFRVADALMAYDPRYSNVLPYGRATPNRRGVHLGATYEPENSVGAMLDLALLREIRGQGTTQLKDFVRVQAGLDVPVGALARLGRGLDLTLGTQIETTRRGGEPIEEVDLTSILLEAGLSAELYDRLDLLLGSKFRASTGRDYLPTIQNFNDVRDFSEPFVTDDQESLVGAGLRYRFKEDVYLTVQVQRFRYARDDAPQDGYRIGQVFALYSMTF